MKCDGRKAFVGVDGIATLVSVLSGKVNFQARRLFKRKRKFGKFFVFYRKSVFNMKNC
jgi:hypothetical protein